MTHILTDQQREKFYALRNLISISTFGQEIPQNHYDLDRFNFCFSVSSTMHDTSPSEFLDRCRIWFSPDNEPFAAIVTEGENSGEAFFVCNAQKVSGGTAEEMLEFAARACSTSDNGVTTSAIRVADSQSEVLNLLAERGYIQGDWSEPYSGLTLNQNHDTPPVIPRGVELRDGRHISPQDKGLCHSQAFQYAGNVMYEERIVTGFSRMQEMPDYMPFLDLAIVSPGGQIASIMSFWYDPVNRRAHLEPAATAPEFQGMGFGRALIQEGARRLRQLGARRILVGSDMKFYLRAGFELLHKTPVYVKTW